MTSTHANRGRVHPEDGPRHISVRELQVEIDNLHRELAAGASFVLTDRGLPVGRLTALNEPRVVPARNPGRWEELDIEPPRSGPSVMEILDELRDLQDC